MTRDTTDYTRRAFAAADALATAVVDLVLFEMEFLDNGGIPATVVVACLAS